MDKRQENILEQLREFKAELIKNSDKNVKIEDVIYLGNVKFEQEQNGKTITVEKPLYIVKSQKEIIDEKGKKSIEKINNYYLEKECIGGYLQENQYILRDSIQGKQRKAIEEKLKSVSDKTNEVISLEEQEDKRLGEFAKALGVDKEKIQSIDEVDLKQELPEEENTINQRDTLHINTEEETDLQQVVNGRTLENLLGLQKAGIKDGDKLARAKTSDVNKYTDKKSSTTYSFVVIKNNGDIVPIGENILRPDRRTGKNTSKSNTTINNDGVVNEETALTSYEIVNSSGKSYLKLGYDENSGLEIKYSEFSNRTGEYVDIELATQRTYWQNNDVYELKKDGSEGINKANNIKERADEHDKYGDVEKDVTLVDNDKNNDSHIHIEDEEAYAYAKNIFDNNADISEVFTEKEVAENIKKYYEKCNYDIEKTLETVEKDMETDAQMLNRKR